MSEVPTALGSIVPQKPTNGETIDYLLGARNYAFIEVGYGQAIEIEPLPDPASIRGWTHAGSEQPHWNFGGGTPLNHTSNDSCRPDKPMGYLTGAFSDIRVGGRGEPTMDSGAWARIFRPNQSLPYRNCIDIGNHHITVVAPISTRLYFVMNDALISPGYSDNAGSIRIKLLVHN